MTPDNPYLGDCSEYNVNFSDVITLDSLDRKEDWLVQVLDILEEVVDDDEDDTH